ncbi:MAG TPA: DUF3303 family protein [Dehalococcoidia bacterium]|nr:DUF3303 family protein [Dehalococcoidia bacterium]
MTQRHTPETCADFSAHVRRTAEAGWPIADVTVHHAVAASHCHTWYYVLESDSYEAIWRGLGPLREQTTLEIAPVHEVLEVGPGRPFPYASLDEETD